MSHACQAKAARHHARNRYSHVARLGRPIYTKMSAAKSAARLRQKVLMEQRIRQGKKK